jgi:hypothetical protein
MTKGVDVAGGAAGDVTAATVGDVSGVHGDLDADAAAAPAAATANPSSRVGAGSTCCGGGRVEVLWRRRLFPDDFKWHLWAPALSRLPRSSSPSSVDLPRSSAPHQHQHAAAAGGGGIEVVPRQLG